VHADVDVDTADIDPGEVSWLEVQFVGADKNPLIRH
jgi:hypothetical protein